MDDFENDIVEFIQRESENIVQKGYQLLVVDPKTIEMVQYGPVYSECAQRKIFEIISEAKVKETKGKSQNLTMNEGYSKLFKLEDEIQNTLIPTAIKEALKEVLSVNESEARRLFKLGPKEF